MNSPECRMIQAHCFLSMPSKLAPLADASIACVACGVMSLAKLILHGNSGRCMCASTLSARPKIRILQTDLYPYVSCLNQGLLLSAAAGAYSQSTSSQDHESTRVVRSCQYHNTAQSQPLGTLPPGGLIGL